MTILVTGGAGYIGSHTAVELLEAGHDVVVVDNLSNASPKAVERVEQITGKKVRFYEQDVRDAAALAKVFAENPIDWVIHFAGLKAVGESVAKPLEYYDNNLGSTLTLLEIMRKFGVKKIVFSSSATVYGTPEKLPLDEDCRTGGTTNPYGTSKYMQEQILRDLYISDQGWTIALLRYFNPVGAHASGLIGEDPKGIPNNLFPYITQVAVGKLACLGIFGNDYDTPDGTCVRDYIHVVDLADGHVKALAKLSGEQGGVWIYNLGTGHGYSVMDMVKAFEESNQLKINYVFKDRRPGDVPQCYADPAKAERELGWKAKNGIKEMCEDAWRWQKNNPNGYDQQ